MLQTYNNALGIPDGRHPADRHLRELMLRLLALPAEQIAPAIAQAHATLIELLGIECSVLVETKDRGETPVITCASPASTSRGESSLCQPGNCPVCQKVLRGEFVRFPSKEDPGTGTAQPAETFCALGYRSVLGFPLSDGGEVLGALLFASSQPQDWPEDLVAQLDFMARVFGSALARERAELACRREEGQHGKLLESVRAIVWRADAVTLQTTFVSNAAESILGYPREEWLKPREEWAKRVHPDDREQVIDYVAKAVREQRDCEHEHRVVTADGRTLWLRDLVHVVVENGQAKELIGVAFDITQLKKAKEALRQAVAEVERLTNKLQEENVYLRQKTRINNGHHRITGQSPAIRRVLAEAEQVAPTDSTALLLGETGTGKELLAFFIHDSSPRRNRAMVSVNCAAMPGPLIESELFGREKGAFTGSLSRQVGRFELADGSTIFLDEVGELSLDVQSKLLRVLESKVIERLGNPKPVSVNVRIIAATNRDLEKAIADGKFRQDLYYRLNVFPITLPPLRERREDIASLAWGFVDEFANTFNKNIESIERESMEALQRYAWPGNIRELRNVIERAMIVATGPKLRIHLPPSPTAMPSAPSRKLDDLEREHILSMLEESGWRVRGPNGAAAKLGLKPTTLEARMAKLGIRRPSAASDL